MNLYVYILNGIPLTEVQRWSVRQLQGNAAFIASSTLPSVDYVDVSSVENWSEHGIRTGKDYKFIRNEIKLLADTIAWTDLTASEKDICVKLFVVDKSKRDKLYTIDEQIQLGYLFHGKSIKARDRRWSHAEMQLMSRLTKYNWRLVYVDLNKENLVSQYIDNGLEGIVEGDDDGGLFDYIDKGLRGQSFTPIDIVDMDALADLILDIIRNGNY